MTRFERWAVWSTSILTTVTGLVYLWMKYFLVSDDPLAVVNHPWQSIVLKVHIVVAPLLTFAIGLVALRHIWRHMQAGARRGRRTGYTTAIMTAPMIFTGYLIQAVTGEGLLRAMVVSHIAFGVVYAVGLLLHQFAIRGVGRGDNSNRPATVTRHRVRRHGHGPARDRLAVGVSSQSTDLSPR